MNVGGQFSSSARERRLWIRLATVVVAIWSTLGLAGTLVSRLRDSPLLVVLFIVCFLSVLAAIVGSALKRRPDGREIWTLVGITAVYMMVGVRMGVPLAERTHLFEYGLVAVLILEALNERRRNGRRVPAPAAIAVGMTAALGWVDEAIQAFLPNRVYDPRDVAVNILAGAMAVAASVLMTRVRSWAKNDPPDEPSRRQR